MKEIDSRFRHDPEVKGFYTLVSAFGKFISGRIEYDAFMVKWYKSSSDARVEFKRFMESFKDVTEAIFKDLGV